MQRPPRKRRPLALLESAALAMEPSSPALATRDDRVGPEADGRVWETGAVKQSFELKCNVMYLSCWTVVIIRGVNVRRDGRSLTCSSKSADH